MGRKRQFADLQRQVGYVNESDRYEFRASIGKRGVEGGIAEIGSGMLRKPCRNALVQQAFLDALSTVMASPDRMEYCLSKAGQSAFTTNLAIRLAAWHPERRGGQVLPGLHTLGLIEGWRGDGKRLHNGSIL